MKRRFEIHASPEVDEAFWAWIDVAYPPETKGFFRTLWAWIRGKEEPPDIFDAEYRVLEALRAEREREGREPPCASEAQRSPGAFPDAASD